MRHSPPPITFIDKTSYPHTSFPFFGLPAPLLLKLSSLGLFSAPPSCGCLCLLTSLLAPETSSGLPLPYQSLATPPEYFPVPMDLKQAQTKVQTNLTIRTLHLTLGARLLRIISLVQLRSRSVRRRFGVLAAFGVDAFSVFCSFLGKSEEGCLR
jgi:hypothetical protein